MYVCERVCVSAVMGCMVHVAWWDRVAFVYLNPGDVMRMTGARTRRAPYMMEYAYS